MPETFGNLTIEGNRLNLSNNELEFLPNNFILSLTYIKYLDLSSNKLNSLPDNFGNIQLINLDLSKNQLESLPDNFGNMSVII